jgi:hypothetical protein
MIIPLVKNAQGNITCSENYRGITLSPVISKMLELILMEMVKGKLDTSYLQFGFKKKSSCNHAIYALRSVVNHYVNNGNTVTLCSLDISKAFDRVDVFALMMLLMKRKVPRLFISVMLDWFEKSTAACVRWVGALSSTFKIASGVRQGGILSPHLFAIYVQVLIDKIKDSGYGCKIHNVFWGCIAYADDLVLMSHSCTAMQYMLRMCEQYADDFNVKFNASKTVVIRIGCRFNALCSQLEFNGSKLEYVTSMKYLGVDIVASRRFKCTYDRIKSNFYRTFNAIYSKSKGNKCELTSVELMRTYCLPAMLYAVEVTYPTKVDCAKLDNCINLAIIKMFHVTDRCNIQELRSRLRLTDVKALVEKRKEVFLSKVINDSYFINLIRCNYRDFLH